MREFSDRACAARNNAMASQRNNTNAQRPSRAVVFPHRSHADAWASRHALRIRSPRVIAVINIRRIANEHISEKVKSVCEKHFKRLPRALNAQQLKRGLRDSTCPQRNERRSTGNGHTVSLVCTGSPKNISRLG